MISYYGLRSQTDLLEQYEQEAIEREKEMEKLRLIVPSLPELNPCLQRLIHDLHNLRIHIKSMKEVIALGEEI